VIPYLEKSLHKKGLLAQGVGPEFKPQYLKILKENIKKTLRMAIIIFSNQATIVPHSWLSLKPLRSLFSSHDSSLSLYVLFC
jgi:hypothetical protein